MCNKGETKQITVTEIYVMLNYGVCRVLQHWQTEQHIQAHYEICCAYGRLSAYV